MKVKRRPSLLLDNFSTIRMLNRAVLSARRVRIVSHPRSGRSWLRVMLHELGVDPRFIHAGAKGDLQRTPENVCNGIEKYYSCRVVFLHRDPRDVVVSFFHHTRRRQKWDSDLSSFIRDPRWGIEKVIVFNLCWLEHATKFADFVPIAYEDLRANPELNLMRLVLFMNCHLSRLSEIQRTISKTSFDTMKKQEQTGELHTRYGDRFTQGGNSDEKMIVRRGVVGGYSDELSETDQAYCEQVMKSHDYALRIENLKLKIRGEN